jgi:hypothetical protein
MYWLKRQQKPALPLVHAEPELEPAIQEHSG